MAETEGLKRMRLRRAGTCSLCGLALGQGTEAYYQAATRTVRCLECPAQSQPAEPTALDMGVAGGSAQSEFERRRDARAARVKGRLGNFVGGVVLGLSDEPQSTRAWASGAVGERGLAEALGHIEGLQVLHDRSVPGTGATSTTSWSLRLACSSLMRNTIEGLFGFVIGAASSRPTTGCTSAVTTVPSSLTTWAGRLRPCRLHSLPQASIPRRR